MFLQTCARVLLDEPDRRLYLRRFRRTNLENVQRQALSKAVNSMARKVVYCPYCSATNGAVKKAGALKIIHDKFRAKKTADELEKWKLTFASAIESQKELGIYINKAVHEDLNPLKVLDLFRRISNEVMLILLIRCCWTCLIWLIGLRTAWITAWLGSSRGIYMAIPLSASRLYSAFCCTGRGIKRR